MKLDSIIYDKDSLKDALIEQWTTESPEFASMYPSDTTTSLANAFAGFGAMLQYCLVSCMANCYTDTAFSDKAIYQLAVTLGNIIRGKTSSHVLVTITKNNLVGVSTTIPEGTKFTINGKSFFNPQGILLPAGVTQVENISLLQGELLTVTKTSTGTPYERFYFSSDFKCNHEYVTVTVNDETWSVSDSFLDYDKSYITQDEELNVVVLKTDSTGRSYVKVGDNQFGNLPPSGSVIKITYVSNDGPDGNIGETNVQGELDTNLVFLDGNNNQTVLSLDLITTTTAYGGSDTQSIDTLRYSSPYVFASGHRAIRRQDYNAILQSQCGYLTTSVWGEYEEAKEIGTYDAIMMNMVYYTGLKSYVTYPYTQIGELSDKSGFVGSISSTKGFCGSHAIKIVNNKDESKYIMLQDTGAQNQLFINDDSLDRRDSLLPIWKLVGDYDYKKSDTIVVKAYEYTASIVLDSGNYQNGSEYSLNDVFELVDDLGKSIGIFGRVTEINSTGGVSSFKLQGKYSENGKLAKSSYNTQIKHGSTLGSGLKIKLELVGEYTNKFISTNDLEGNNETASHPYPIYNARSDRSGYYESLITPTLQTPVQIRLDYSYRGEEIGIAAVKFEKSESSSPFIGSFAMYGTTKTTDLSYDNVRNSEDWTRILDLTKVIDPATETGSSWTEWYPTTCVKDSDSITGFDRYNNFVIEIYETADSTSISSQVAIGGIKLLYEDDASFLYYDENGDLDIQLPVYGEPGIGDDNGYLTQDLLNETDYKLYDYNVEVNGITRDNGYRNDNVLAYVYNNSGTSIPFYVNVLDIDNQKFRIYLNDSTNLTGNVKINTKSKSLDDNIVYSYTLTPDTGAIPTKSDYLYELKQSLGEVVYAKKSFADIKVGDEVYFAVGGVKGTVQAKKTSGTISVKLKTLPEKESAVDFTYTGNNTYQWSTSTTNVFVTKPKSGSSSEHVRNGDLVYDENFKQVGYVTNSVYTTENNVENVTSIDVYFYSSESITTGFSFVDNSAMYLLKSTADNIVYCLSDDPSLYDVVYNNSYTGVGTISKIDDTGYTVKYYTESKEVSGFKLSGDHILGDRQGQGYEKNEKVTVNGTNNQLQLLVSEVDETKASKVDWVYNTMTYAKTDTVLSGVCETTSTDSETPGTGLKVELVPTALSGNDESLGSGATISITSTNNLSVNTSFKGNRIDSQDISYVDDPIMNKYNHFTTYMEFKQPEINQVDIYAKVCLSTNAATTSSMILQEISNNINALFDIQPDSIGKGLKISDIYAAIINTPNVKWCRVLKPTNNVPYSRNMLMVLSNLTLVETDD